MINWFEQYHSPEFVSDFLKTQTHLFNAENGIGADLLIENFLHKLLCENLTNDKQPCNACPSCRYLTDEHPNIRLIDNNPELKSDVITIDQIRELSSFIELASTSEHDKKIIFIKNAHYLTSSAANALLKNLEEPPNNTFFILLTSNLHKILPTIRSRSTIHKLTSPSKVQCEDFLKEKHQEAIKFLDLAEHKPFLAIQMAADKGLINSILKVFLRGKSFDMMDVNENLLASGPQFFVDLMQKWIVDLAQFKEFKTIYYFKNLQDQIELISNQLSYKELLNFYKKLIEYRRLSETTINKSIALDNLMIDYKRIFV